MNQSTVLKQIQAKLDVLDAKVSALLSKEKKEQLLKELEQEEEASNWAVKLVRMGRKGRLDTLKAKGLI